jgi:ribosomal-protein-alanine N-acetyltransferase
MRQVGTVRIDTERLALRRFRESDLQELFDNYGSDPEVGRFISFNPSSSLDGAREFIDMHIQMY